MQIKQIRTGYFVLCNNSGFPVPVTIARAYFKAITNKLEIV